MESELFDVDRITGGIAQPYSKIVHTPEAWKEKLEREDEHIRGMRGLSVKESHSYRNNGSTNGFLPSHPIHLNK